MSEDPQIGDRVVCVREYPGEYSGPRGDRQKRDGQPGTVVDIDSYAAGFPYHVQFDNPELNGEYDGCMAIWCHQVRKTEEPRRSAILEDLHPETDDALPAVLDDPKSDYDTRSSQIGGSHYLKAVQVWDIIDCYRLDFYEGSVLKYLLRWREKNGLEDLRKARHYLDKIIERQTIEKPARPADYFTEVTP